MKIEQIYIQNFRGYEQISFALNPTFTVAIGDNGKGKSTLLHALQVALGAYLQCLPNIPATIVYRRQFRSDERFVKWDQDKKDYIANEDETNIFVLANFSPNAENVRWVRRLHFNGVTSHNVADTGALIETVNNLMASRKLNQNIPLPVIANFGIERTSLQLKKGKKTQKKRSRLEKGYLASLSNKSSFDGVIEWLSNYKNELIFDREFIGTYEALFEAITTAIPYLKDVSFNQYYQELEAIVTIDENQLGKKTHSNMSDGLIAMLNLVAELAYRCVILNGFMGKDAVKNSPGVVLIDEIDMHLHPNWQRHVISDLKKAFPKIQFVVTTHSPFIVQSVTADELIILDGDISKDGDPTKKSIEEVASNEMGVDDIPRSIEFLEMVKVAEEYFKLVRNGKTSENDKNALELSRKLDEFEIDYGHDPAFVAALKIERKANGL